MEDAATAEISRSQIWQWIRHGAKLEDGRAVTASWSRGSSTRRPDADPRRGRRGDLGGGPPGGDARRLRAVALGDELPEFLTEVAYELLD